MLNSIVFPVCVLLTTAFLWPSEGAIGGDGLHLVVGWLAVTAYAVATGRSSRGTVGWLATLPLVLLVSGFWLSTWHVFRVEGDRRAALNLAFEWTAIGSAWWLVRQINTNGIRQLLMLIAAIGVGLSTMGILQYYVANQRQADWYRGKQQALASASPGAKRAIEAELQQSGIPSHGASRELFERRLLASSESVGPFALANTLGGVLAVVLVLLVAGVLNELDASVRPDAVFWVCSVLLLGIVGYCLMLTKSRTAWVGSVAGMAFLFGQRSSGLFAWVKRTAIVVLVVCAAGGVGVLTGAIDREVVLESPKSLQYRLFYWMGAAGVIAESPIFGAGPGNFRQSYLKWKVPESSEEILDPHNLFVDAWCSAGLAGLVAVVLMVGGVLQLSRRHRSSIASASAGPGYPTDAGSYPSASLLVKAVAAGTVVHLIWRWIGGRVLWDVDSDFFLSQNLILIVPGATCVGLMVLCSRVRIPAAAAGAASVCLLVHLLGAGGLQISVCGIVLVVLYAIYSSDSKAIAGQQAVTKPGWLSVLQRGAVFGIAATAVLVCYYGLVPVEQSKYQRQLASARASSGDKNAAAAAYREAIAKDPLSVESRQQNAEFLAYSYLTALGQYAPSNLDGNLPDILQKQYAGCLNACAELIDGDRQGIRGYVIRSQVQQSQAVVFSDKDALNSAIVDLRHVLSVYPTNAKFWAELAVLCERAGDFAAANVACERALIQEEINRSWGHVDRYLDDDLRQSLGRIGSTDSGSR